jgi:hypothetical protein
MSEPLQLTLTHLRDVPKLGVKGPGAEEWLRRQGIEQPPATYDTRRLADGDRIIRLGTGDFLFEGVASGGLLPRLSAELGKAPPGVYRVERQDTTFLLTGEKATRVLAQLCSIDFRDVSENRFILTRAGGVNCGVLPERIGESPSFRLLVDCTYAASFWEALRAIVEELGGHAIESA